MSRVAKPPAEVPTLTEIVYALDSGHPAGPSSNATTVLSRELQKKIARRVVQRLGKTLKAQLRKVSQQPIGENRNGPITFLCGEIEHSVRDAVNQAFAQQANEAAVLSKKRQRQVAENTLKIMLTKNNNVSG